MIIPMRASARAVSPMPIIRIRSGAAAEKRPSIMSPASTAADPNVAAIASSTGPAPGSRIRTAIRPSPAPAPTPVTSGLAISLPVSRWRSVPATASRAPAPKAAATRGRRHGRSAARSDPVAKAKLPSGARPTTTVTAASAAMTRNAATAQRGSSRRRLGPRASVGRDTAFGFRREIRKRSAGTPRKAVAAPVGSTAPVDSVSAFTPRSVVARRRAPSPADQSSRAPIRRAPRARARAGAIRPTKPITPTALVTAADSATARATVSARTSRTGRPIARAAVSSRSIAASDRTRRPAITKSGATRTRRATVGDQSSCASAPPPQR